VSGASLAVAKGDPKEGLDGMEESFTVSLARPFIV
jgi:hypothetical protein